jgi:hypothetical protein
MACFSINIINFKNRAKYKKIKDHFNDGIDYKQYQKQKNKEERF